MQWCRVLLLLCILLLHALWLYTRIGWWGSVFRRESEKTIEAGKDGLGLFLWLDQSSCATLFSSWSRNIRKVQIELKTARTETALQKCLEGFAQSFVKRGMAALKVVSGGGLAKADPTCLCQLTALKLVNFGDLHFHAQCSTESGIRPSVDRQAIPSGLLAEHVVNLGNDLCGFVDRTTISLVQRRSHIKHATYTCI